VGLAKSTKHWFVIILAPTRQEARMRPVAGFSLVELMIAVCIAGILAAIAAPNYIAYRDRVRTTVIISDMKMIEQKIKLFSMDNGALPDTLAQVGMDGLRDPWGRPYQYLRIDGGPPSNNGKRRKDHFMVPVNSDFDLYSMGPDGKSVPAFTGGPSQDDIVRAFDGAYFGKVADL
jgi:general secretion pathway protein G